MYCTPIFKTPGECTEEELREFERLVRQGFAGSDETLPARIRAAKRLAFQHLVDGALVAIAGLKEPQGEHTAEVFAKAEAVLRSDDPWIELGWVFVVPRHREKHIATNLCTELLKRSPGSRVFATTRPDNGAMIQILQSLGFLRIGRTFLLRGRELALFVGL